MSSSDFNEWGEEPLVKIHSSHISVERKFKASPKRVWDLSGGSVKLDRKICFLSEALPGSCQAA
jgi:hypothetical protein